jgi:hypothetical protein
MEYLRRVNFGPTESGSVVLTIESSVPPRLREARSDRSDDIASMDDSEPFERAVGLTLARSVQAARSIVDEVSTTQQGSSLADGIQAGVSSNLCDAIAGLVAPGASQSLQMRFRWAASRPAPFVSRDVTFDGDTHPILLAMAEQLRENSIIEEYDVFGPVRHLTSTDVGNGGTVRVVMMGPPGRGRIATIALNEADYRVAHKAHGADQWISCTGELLRAKSTFQLLNPRDFRIVTDDSDGTGSEPAF